MAVSLTHSFVSTKAQGGDATVVSKNEWNQEHAFTMQSGYTLGRLTSSTGAVEEIPIIFRILTADISLADVNTAQELFTAGAFTAEAATSYQFDAFYHVTRAAGANSHTTGLLFGGGATFTSLRYLIQAANPTGNALSAVSSIVGEAATEVVITGANTSTTENIIARLNGIIRVNAGGTIIPQLKYSVAPGGTPTFKANSYFLMRKLGSNTAATSGSWA